ncbi:extracellular solute-binding protein [Paenibacillus filicis]|uniref:Extracellular solute-binding protein n=1 Tax=Paenibacillus filicis TaxID=669464 RepID=A0ABU9DGJ7_9BACL
MKVKIQAIAAAAMLTSLLAACSQSADQPSGAGAPASAKEEAKAGQTVQISAQLHVTPNLTAEFWDGVIKKFEEQNPGVKIKRVQAPEDPEQYVKMLLASGDMPDVVHNVRFPDLVKANALKPFELDDDIKKIRDVESGFINGKLYNLNDVVQPQSLIFYNKKMFADAGITSTPKTWDELMADAEKLKQKSFTPFLTSGEWVTGFTMSVLSAPDTFGQNVRWYADRAAGKVHFTDDNWKTAAQRWVDMNAKGYFNKGALSLSYTQLEQQFLKGAGAMYPMGSWFTAAEKDAKDKGFEVGVFAVPSTNGDLRLAGGINQSGFGISQKSKHADIALKFVKFLLLDRDNHKAIIEKDALISNLKDPVDYPMTPLQTEIAKLVKEAKVLSGHVNVEVGDSVGAPGMAEEFNKAAQNLLMGNKVDQVLKSLDEMWDKNSK